MDDCEGVRIEVGVQRGHSLDPMLGAQAMKCQGQKASSNIPRTLMITNAAMQKTLSYFVEAIDVGSRI